MSGWETLGILILAVSPLTADLQFSNSYHADDVPENADPKWIAKGKAGEATVSDGALNVKSEGEGKRHFFLMEDPSQWNMSSGLATVEFRMKCASADPEDEVFRVQLSDGKQMWRAAFFNGRCNGGRAATEDWDTYTLTVRDGKMQIHSEKIGVIASNIEPSPLVDKPALLFGTFKSSQNPALRNWDLDFIRWTNEELK